MQNKNSDNRANLDGWLDSTWRRYRHQLWTDSSNIDIKCKNCLWHQIFDTRPGVIFKIITRNVFVLSFADDLFVLIPNFFLQLVVILVPLSTCGWEGFFEMWLFSKSSFEAVWLTAQWDDKVWQVEKKELIGDEEPGCWLVFHSFTSSGGRGLLIFQSGNQGQMSYFKICKMFTLLNSSVGILDEVLEKGRAETVNYSSSVMFHICQVSKLCLESAGIAWVRVSENSRSQPLPGMKASHSRPWNSGMDFFIPFPFTIFSCQSSSIPTYW